MKNNDALDTLTDIRSMMERSTKFLSLSGLSAVLIGVYALVTAGIVFGLFGQISPEGLPKLVVNTPYKLHLVIWFSLGLLLLSLATAFGLAYRKHQKAIKLDAPFKRLAWSFSLPMLIGGALCVAMLAYGHYGLTSTLMLVFYGLALVQASSHTYSNVKYLGYGQIVLGLLDSFIPGYALIFWVLGFGVLHIVYGWVFYCKYDR